MLKPSTGETRDLYQKPASPLSDKYYFCGKGGFFIIIYFLSNILKYQRPYSKKEKSVFQPALQGSKKRSFDVLCGILRRIPSISRTKSTITIEEITEGIRENVIFNN